MNRTLPAALLVALLLPLFAATVALAQNDKDSRLKNSAPRVRQHVKQILSEYKGHEGYGKQVANKANTDGKQKQWKCGNGTCPGAKDHDWDPNSNQNSEQDYKDDSEKVMVNDDENLRELWSCFEPGRIKYTPPPDPLDVMCDAWCPPPIVCEYVCPGPRRVPRNRHSVYEEWRPYHVAYINNYGINRLNPSEQSAKGDEYMKQQLLSRKQESEREEKNMLEQKEAIKSQYVSQIDSKRDTKGQGHGAGFFQSSDMLIDKLYGHGARTRWSYKFSEERQPEICLGWAERDDCIANTAAPKKNEKDILNLWTEFGMLDVVWNMPEMTKRHSQRESDMYEATAYPEETISQAGKNKKKAEDWIKSKSPAAWRRKTWSKTYDDLKEVEIGQSNNQKQEEFVYFTTELGPLTGTVNATLGLPELSAGATLSRRVFYVMGSKDFLKYHNDNPQEKGRMNEYTVVKNNKSREIDKMQRIWPRRGNKPSECFRSQRIPNMVNTTENQWAKQNFPYDLIHYVDEHYGEMTYAYWNKVVYCACEKCSIPTKSGCTLMEPRMHPEVPGDEGRGDGDQPYGQFENLECRYREGKFPSPWALEQQSCGAGDRPPGESVYEGNRDGNPDV